MSCKTSQKLRVKPLSLLLSLAFFGACSKEAPPAPTPTKTTSAAASSAALKTVNITDAESEQIAKAIEREVSITAAEGMQATLWASEKLLGDTVAINVDHKGRIWAGISHRSNNSEFDIRGYPDWEHPSMTFSTIDDRRAFLHQIFAPENSDKNEKLPDRNKDGIRDWKDLAVMQEQVVRLEDTTGNGTADVAQTVISDFNTEVTDVIGGMYYDNQHDNLYITVAPDLWKVKDTDGDGAMDEKKSLAFGYGVHIGFSGHGLSGATIGPDGRIYYSMGDVGTSVTDSNGKKWHYPNQGVIVRSELDGSNFEVYAAGLRNVYEFVFDKFGNLISVDNDGDHVGEYERVVYPIDGSDSGWRTHWQLGKYKDPKNNTYKPWMDEDYFKPAFEGQAAHVLPPIAPYHAGPSGMTYHPGTGLSEQWKDHFFVVEFVGSAARAGINAFTLKPKGASFELTSDQNIFRGVLPTGLDFGPDGALYMSDWIEGWGLKQKGRIWKLDTPATAASDERKDTRTRLAENFTNYTAEQLSALLQHADMRVRQKAQFELVAREQVEQLQSVAKDETHQLARIHALWGLGQMARKNADINEVLLPFLNDKDPEIRAQAAKLLGDSKAESATDTLIALLNDDEIRVQFFATQALGRIGAKNATAPIIKLLEHHQDSDVFLRQAGAIALARIGNERELSELAIHRSEAVRIAAVVALKQMRSPALSLFLSDSSEFIVTNAARAISDDDFVNDAMPMLAKLLEAPRFKNEPLIRRAINANLYASGSNSSQENAMRLAKFAQRKDIEGTLRGEALKTLAVWESSSDFDRVTGLYRGAVSHNLADAQQALGNVYKTLLTDKSDVVREATIVALAGLNVTDANEELLHALHNDAAPKVRIAALNAIKQFDISDMSKVAFATLNDKNEAVRMVALAILPELNLPVAQVVEMHDLLLQKGTQGEQQAALLSLAKVKAPEAELVFRKQMQLLIEGKIAPQVQLEVITAAEQLGTPELQKLLAEYESKKDLNNPLDVYRESIYGGDVAKGVALFRYSNTTQCVRCHMVGSRGNKVGPDLTTIATRITPDQLLEALVAPAARIAPGFGRVTVVMKNGERIEGSFDAESKKDVTVTANNETKTIALADIEKLEFGGISPMPPMGLGLTKAELRDLVAYLSTLKQEEHEGH